jgi:hypothetical protein
MTKHRKPNTPYDREYSDREDAQFVPSTTEAEHDVSFKVESSHASQDLSVKSDAELSDAELLRRYRVSLTSNILPELPRIEGFHVCWVPMTSNNIYDTVDYRRGIGYSVVKQEEVPGFKSPSNRAGEYEACVSHNELILMKLPSRLFQLYSVDTHHNQPNDQERVIQQNIVQMRDNEGNSIVRDTHEMTGINRLARKTKDPVFQP